MEGILGATATELDDAPDFAPPSEIAISGANPKLLLAGDPYVLGFAGGTYKPEPGTDPRMLDTLATKPGAVTYGYIMVEGRLNHPAKVAQIEALGVRILAPHTWQCFAAEIPPHAVLGLRALPFVRWVGYARPEQKIGPDLRAELAIAQPGQQLAIQVSTFVTDINPASERRMVGGAVPAGAAASAIHAAVQETIANGPFQHALEALGFQLHSYTDTANAHYFTGTATLAQIEAITALDFVAYVSARPKFTRAHLGALVPTASPPHDQSQMMISADRVRGTYHGEPITVGIIDSGLHLSPRHNDLTGKDFVGWASTQGPSPFIDGYGHGTHVAGTIFGAGSVDARYRGTAPRCGNGGPGQRVFVGRLFDDSGVYQGSESRLYLAFSNDYVEGSITNPKPRCVNNSWGAAPGTFLWVGTEPAAQTVDDYVQDHNQNYVFAAGNLTGAGVASPGSAKNVLTVGSIDDHGSSVGNVSSFSSHRTGDYRPKPEVAAPGMFVTSLQAGTTGTYVNDFGTSMATPHVTRPSPG